MEKIAHTLSDMQGNTGFAQVRGLLHDALAQCWKLLERWFTRTDAPYY